MPQKVVMEIPANPMLGDLRKRKRKLRVAAYCRVSTEEDEQQNSFEVQVDYYTEKITHHDGWQLAGIFADDGISGVRTKKRDQFNEMIELCRKKKSSAWAVRRAFLSTSASFPHPTCLSIISWSRVFFAGIYSIVSISSQ